MSKRKKVQISEQNKDLNVSKAKKSFRRKIQLIGESDLQNPAQTFHCNNSPSRATKAGRIKKCKGNNLENTETQILTSDLETSSSAEEGGKASFEREELGHSKVFPPPSQGEKFRPVFTKPKKLLAGRHEKDYGKDSTEQDMLESSGAQCMSRNVPDTAESPFQNTISPSESLGLMDLLLSKGDDSGDQVVLRCEEWSGTLDVKMQDQERIRTVNSDDQKMGTAIKHVKLCEKEMPEKEISFILQASDNEDAEGLKKKELPFGSLIKEMSFSMLAEGKISDHLKSTQCDEELMSSSNMCVEQNKATQDVIKSGYVEEPNWAKNGSGEDAGFVELVASQAQNENNITQPPLVTDVSVLAPEEQSSNLYISSVTRVGSGSDEKGIDQNPLGRNGKTEEQSDMYSSTDVLEAGGAQYNSTIRENSSDQNSLWTSGKPGEQSTPCRREIIVAEQNNYEGQDTSGKDFPDTWSVYIDLEKEVGIPEPKCKQVIETSSLLCPRPDGDVHSETRKTSVQAILYSEEKAPGMTAKPTRNAATSQKGEIPILFQPQQQWKESECEKLVPNIKQVELGEHGLRLSEIRETLLNSGITRQNLTKMPKGETEPKTESTSFSTDVPMDGKEVVTCGENQSQATCVESCLSSTNVLSQLEREMGSPVTNRDIADSEAQQQPLLVSCAGSSICASSDFDTVIQTHSLCRDPMNLEYLPHSQLQDISESNSLEFPLDKLFSLDNQHTHSKGKRDQSVAAGYSGIEPPTPVAHAGLSHPNNAKVEVVERICDPSKQEDATDVVCGLIKELSNLNRLIMSKHRDLDSFKRLKFRRNRQSGKGLLHGVNNMTSTLCTTMKKKKET